MTNTKQTAFHGRRVAIVIEPTTGIPFTLMLKRDENGREVVAFYDARYTGGGFGRYGQFISEYYRETIDRSPRYEGLDLHGGEPNWTLHGDAMAHVHDILQNWGELPS